MKTIKIFLASSIVEFEREREQIENFIRNVSDDFEERHNIKLKPVLCENFDPAMANGRKQEEYNEEIRNSEMIFFIFFTKIGEFTREEFDVAYFHFKKFDKPKIYTYFKELSDGETMEKSLADFMDTLDKELSHYHSMFSSVDTIKLRILLNIKLNALDFVEIKAEDGYCVVDGKKYLSLDNLPEFFNNGILNDLKKELEETEKKYYELKPHYVMNDDEAKRNEYIDVAAKRQRLIDEIDELEKNIFKLSLNISESASDFDISPRLAEAYRLLETGEYEKALIVLDTKEIEDEYQREKAKRKAERELLDKADKAAAKRYIRENKARIDILTTINNYPDKYKEIESLYEKITAEAEEYRIEIGVLYNYAGYLYEQNHFSQAAAAAEKLQDLLKNGEECSDGNKSIFYNLLALIYSKTNRFSEAEELYLDALRLSRNLAEKNPDVYLPDVARTCNNLAYLYDTINRKDEAERLYLEALQIDRKLAEKNPEAYLSDVARTCNNLAGLYDNINRKDKAERLYLEALQIRRNLAEKNPDAYLSDVAGTCNNLAALYNHINRKNEAETLYLEALRIYRDLAKKNPDAYLSYVATTCNNLALLYNHINRKDEAERLYLEALQIIKELAKKNPDAYLPDVATTCNNLALLYNHINRKDEAERLYLEALQIRRNLAEKNPDAYLSDVATTCNNLANLYNDINRKDEAERLYLEALQIYRDLAEKNPDAYLSDVASTCNNLAFLYNDINRKDEAERLYLEALQIRRDLAEKNPDAYLPDVATACNNLAGLYDDINRKDEAERLFLEALQIYRNLAEKNPDAYLPDVATACNNLAYFYNHINRKDEAEKLYNEALQIYRKFAEKNPDAYLPDAAITCFNLAVLYLNTSRKYKADTLLTKASKIAKKYQDVDPRCKQIVDILSRR